MNILISKHGSLGDIFLSLGAIQSIIQHYQDARLFLLTQSNYKNILKKFHEVDTILEDNSDHIILSNSMNKPHGMRECYILDNNGFCWVPSILV